MAAMQLLRQMRDAGVRPTMLSYSKLLFVHAAAVSEAEPEPEPEPQA